MSGIDAPSAINTSSIWSSVTAFQRPTVNGPSVSITGTIRLVATVRRANSAIRANQRSESLRNSASGSSLSHTAVPMASSCTDEACIVG